MTETSQPDSNENAAPAPVIQQVRIEQIGQVRTKLGVSMVLNSLVIWIIAFAVLSMLITISTGLFTGGPVKDGLVFGIAMLIPLIPLFIFLNRRLNNSIKAQGAINDVYYNKTVRGNLIFTLIVTILLAINLVFNILSKLFLEGQQTGEVMVNSFIFLFVSAVLTYFFYHYYNKAKQ